MVCLVQRRCAVHKLSTKKAFIAYFLFGWLLLILADRVSELRVYQGATIAITTLAIASIILLTGYTGQVSLGHGAFLAVGAYSAALAQTYWQSPFWFTLLMSILVTAAFGFILGFAAGRLTGPYLAGTTLALAVGLPTLANQFGFLGGETGLVYDAGMPPARFGESFTLYKWFFWISCLASLIMVWFIANLVSTKYGRTFRAMRDNPIAAQISGINVGRLKVTAFAISSGVAGLSGGLLVMLISGVSPSAFPLSLSFALLGGAVVTGLYNLKGVILGGLILVAMPEIADSVVSLVGGSEGLTTSLPDFLVSALLILAVVFTPNGPGHILKRHH